VISKIRSHICLLWAYIIVFAGSKNILKNNNSTLCFVNDVYQSSTEPLQVFLNIVLVLLDDFIVCLMQPVYEEASIVVTNEQVNMSSLQINDKLYLTV